MAIVFAFSAMIGALDAVEDHLMEDEAKQDDSQRSVTLPGLDDNVI